MAPIPPLFTVPLESSGSITCTLHAPQIYLLRWNSPPDNRLTPTFINALTLALDIIEHRHPVGVVVTTSAIPKFYSNGLDYESAIKDYNFFPEILYPFWRRFLTYPMPTIALIPGHAFAGGLMTAMMHDYRFAHPSKGFLCCNELDFGAHLPSPMASIFREKLPSPHTFRQMVLESKRYTGPEALKEGIVDGLVEGLEPVVEFVRQRKLAERGRTKVYGRLKAELWRETVLELEGGWAAKGKDDENLKEEKRRREEQVKRVETWEKEGGGKIVAKL